MTRLRLASERILRKSKMSLRPENTENKFLGGIPLPPFPCQEPVRNGSTSHATSAPIAPPLFNSVRTVAVVLGC
jgi:hypothetical protein